MQGVGSALLSPAALALLSLVSPPGAARRRAVGWWTAAAATGGASGWLLGGVLTEYLAWRAVFWVNLPIGISTALVAARVLPAGARTSCRRLDLLGSVGISTALALLVYGLTRLAPSSMSSPASWIPILLAIVGLGLVVRHERKITDPLVPSHVFRSRAAAGAIVAALLITATTTPPMYLWQPSTFGRNSIWARLVRPFCFRSSTSRSSGGRLSAPTCSGGLLPVQPWYRDSSG